MTKWRHLRLLTNDDVCVVCTLMLSTARWQHAARTEYPSWKYHSASSLHTLWRRLDRRRADRARDCEQIHQLTNILGFTRKRSNMNLKCVCVCVCVCAQPLVSLSVIHIICHVVDWRTLRCTNVAFTCSLKQKNIRIIFFIFDQYYHNHQQYSSTSLCLCLLLHIPSPLLLMHTSCNYSFKM